VAMLVSWTETAANTRGMPDSPSTTFPLMVIKVFWSAFLLSRAYSADTACVTKAARINITVSNVYFLVLMVYNIKVNKLN